MHQSDKKLLNNNNTAAATDDHEYDHGGIKNHAMVSHLRIIGNDHQVGVDEPTKVPGATSNPSVFIHKSSTKWTHS